MLGFRGRSHRREFAGGVALLFVGPTALAMALMPIIPRINGLFQRDVALVILLALTGLITVAAGFALWGWAVLLTRRARDMGWPAWLGVPLALAVGALAEAVLPPLPATLAGFAWLILMAAWPSRPRAVEQARVFG